MKTTVKVNCVCTEGSAAKFQDSHYGKGVRIANVTPKGDAKNRDVRCTVCGTIHRKSVE